MKTRIFLTITTTLLAFCFVMVSPITFHPLGLSGQAALASDRGGGNDDLLLKYHAGPSRQNWGANPYYRQRATPPATRTRPARKARKAKARKKPVDPTFMSFAKLEKIYDWTVWRRWFRSQARRDEARRFNIPGWMHRLVIGMAGHVQFEDYIKSLPSNKKVPKAVKEVALRALKYLRLELMKKEMMDAAADVKLIDGAKYPAMKKFAVTKAMKTAEAFTKEAAKLTKEERTLLGNADFQRAMNRAMRIR